MEYQACQFVESCAILLTLVLRFRRQDAGSGVDSCRERVWVSCANREETFKSLLPFRIGTRNLSPVSEKERGSFAPTPLTPTNHAIMRIARSMTKPFVVCVVKRRTKIHGFRAAIAVACVDACRMARPPPAEAIYPTSPARSPKRH